jgi:hypothetical protein
MGFNAELLMVYPVRQPPKEKASIWCAQESISFGYITRLQKLIECVRDYNPHARAGICTFSYMYFKLVEKLKRGPQWQDFAPFFLIYERFSDQAEAYQAASWKENLEFVDCGICRSAFEYAKPPNPSAHHRAQHNQILQDMNQDQLNCYVNDSYNIIMDPPTMWESCATIAAWLDELENNNTPEWQEVQKDPLSLAKFRGWREYLREIGKAEARALFIFPR